MRKLLSKLLERAQQALSANVQRANIVVIVGSVTSAATTQLCLCGAKAAVEMKKSTVLTVSQQNVMHTNRPQARVSLGMRLATPLVECTNLNVLMAITKPLNLSGLIQGLAN